MTNPPIEPLPFISILIVTRNNHDECQRAVDSLCAGTWPADRREIIVLEETDAPQPVTGPNVHYHTLPVRNLGVGYARNRALEKATGEIIVFTDDDCTMDLRWLEELIRPLLDDPKAGASCGAVYVPPCGPVGRCENILGFPGGGVRFVHQTGGETVRRDTFSTCNCAIRRRVLDELSLRFHEGFQTAGEDELLSRQISMHRVLYYNPQAVVYHRPRDRWSKVIPWFARRGQAAVEMLQFRENRRTAVFKLLRNSPLLRITGFLVLVSIAGLPLLPVLGLTAALYYGFLLFRYRWAWRYHPDWKTFAILPVLKLILDLSMDFGILRTLLRNRKKGSKKRSDPSADGSLAPSARPDQIKKTLK